MKILIAFLFIVIAQGILSAGASAQGCPKVWIGYCPTCGDKTYPGMHGCEVEGPFEEVCELPNWLCAAANAALETLTCHCDQGPSPTTPTATRPVSLATGNTFITQNDISLPGLGGGLSLTREWNSMWPAPDSAYQIGIFGPNWRSTYEEQVFVGSDYYFKYLRSDGSIVSFGYGPSKPSKYANADMISSSPFSMLGSSGSASSRWSASAASVGGGGGGGECAVYIRPTYFSIAYADGSSRNFDINSGKLIAIVDRNGNTTTVSHDSLGRVSTVADPAGRHLYFSYGSGSTSLVTAITTDFGVSTSYSYDTQGRLVQVTEPDSSTISFQYDSHSLITSVLDSNGHVLEAHTYDSSGRGLTSSQANGVNAISLTYNN